MKKPIAAALLVILSLIGYSAAVLVNSRLNGGGIVL